MLRGLVMHEQNTQSSFDFASRTMHPKSSRFGKETLFFAILPDQGRIEVESEPGRGTRFRVRLPSAARSALPDEAALTT